VEDRGLGLSPDELDDINARLASPAEFDLASSEQLGLFVVSRLAARHTIKVSLRRSAYGGTTAVVLLPFGVVVRREEASRAGLRDDQLDDTLARGLTGRHRMHAIGSGRGAGGGANGAEREWPTAPWETMPLERTAGTSRPLSSPAAPGSPGVPGSGPPWETAAPPWSPAPQPGPPQPERPQLGTSMPGTSRPEPSWPEPSRAEPSWPEPSRPEPSRAEQAAGAALTDPSGALAGAMSSGSHLGMPIRVPQASLAPQLRAGGGDPQVPQAAADDDAPGTGLRSPEATRTMLTSMQQGWRRGRVDDLDHPKGAPGTGTD